jgi:hypothetical protein
VDGTIVWWLAHRQERMFVAERSRVVWSAPRSTKSSPDTATRDKAVHAC